MSSSAGLTCPFKKFCPLSWKEKHTRHQKKMESLRKCYRHYSYTSSDGAGQGVVKYCASDVQVGHQWSLSLRSSRAASTQEGAARCCCCFIIRPWPPALRFWTQLMLPQLLLLSHCGTNFEKITNGRASSHFSSSNASSTAINSITKITTSFQDRLPFSQQCCYKENKKLSPPLAHLDQNTMYLECLDTWHDNMRMYKFTNAEPNTHHT